jgi:uncharacterized membrane protein YbhN (UPF0104 family)
VGLGVSQLGDVAPAAWLPDPLGFTAASLLLLGAYFFSAALWGMLVQDLGGPRLPVWTSVQLFMIANRGRYLPGKVWQIAGLATLARGHGVPPATGAGAAVLGQGIALVAASAIGLGAVLTAPPPYPTWGAGVGVAIAILVVLVSIPSVFAPLARAWFRLSRTEAPPALGSVHALRWLALYALNWGAYALSFWILARSLGVDAGVVPAASAFAAAYVLGYVMIFAPAGLGPREGFLIAFLTPHVGATASGVVAVVARLWTTLVELVPAGLFWAR